MISFFDAYVRLWDGNKEETGKNTHTNQERMHMHTEVIRNTKLFPTKPAITGIKLTLAIKVKTLNSRDVREVRLVRMHFDEEIQERRPQVS